MLTLPPLSLYIHIPWCVRKCPYCDFNSHESSTLPEKEYVETLKRDLEQDKLWAQGRKLHSIFFGGGTPSVFSANSIEQILLYAETTIGFHSDIEITLEANPGTFEQNKFAGYYQAGVNRLSIGIQSFQTDHLHTLGRIHTRDEAKRAVAIAKEAGFININLDLMHGLPDQTLAQSQQDLAIAIDLAPQHISWYQLTIEPNTVFYRQPPRLPADDHLADIQQHGLILLSENGYQQYEVSAFAQSGKQSRHNINYWQFGDYIGIGAGAHGKCTDLNNQTIRRRQKTRLPEHYMANAITPRMKETVISEDERPLEFLMNSLRLNDGVPTHFFTERTGLSIDVIRSQLDQLKEQGLLVKNNDRIQATTKGHEFLNTILSVFLNE